MLRRLDLGDRSNWYCVLDGAGEVVLEQKLSTTPKGMNEVFGGLPRSRIALETGMHSPWVSRCLSELGHEVIVAHARNAEIGSPPCSPWSALARKESSLDPPMAVDERKNFPPQMRLTARRRLRYTTPE
jgi:hypothetical protein